MLQVNDTVVLTGKTRHGKNRIQQHGKLWFVQEVRGGKMHLRSDCLLYTSDAADDQ